MDFSAIFDIGPSSVAGAIVRFEKGRAPQVIYTAREMFPFRESIDVDRLFKDMLDALSRVTAGMLKYGSELSIGQVSYVFSPPWASAETRTITLEKKEPFALTADMVARALKEVGPRADSALIGVETSVVQISLNGYPIAEPYGKKARRADISVFTSLIPKAILERIEEVSLQTYRSMDTRTFSFPLAAFTIVRDIGHHTDDFMFLNVGGDVSEILLVRSGIVRETASFPFGSHSIVRDVMKALKVSQSEAESLVALHWNGHADAEIGEKLKSILKSSLERWVSAVHEVLGKLSVAHMLPHELYAVVEGDLARFFLRGLKEEKARQADGSSLPFSVTLLDHEHMKELATFSPYARKDSIIALLAAFVGREKSLDIR